MYGESPDLMFLFLFLQGAVLTWGPHVDRPSVSAPEHAGLQNKQASQSKNNPYDPKTDQGS